MSSWNRYFYFWCYVCLSLSLAKGWHQIHRWLIRPEPCIMTSWLNGIIECMTGGKVRQRHRSLIPTQPYTVVFLFRYHCKPRRAAYCWGVLRIFPRIVPSWRREALPYFPRHWRQLGLPSVPGQPRQVFIQKRLCRWVACALCPQLGWAMRPWIQPIRRWSPFL